MGGRPEGGVGEGDAEKALRVVLEPLASWGGGGWRERADPDPLPTHLRVMVPARPSVPAAGVPRSTVKYSALASTEEDGRAGPGAEEPLRAAGCCKAQGRPRGARSPRCPSPPEPPAKPPYKAIACFALQFVLGASLLLTGCLLLLLGGSISPVGPARALAVLAVGMLVLLPGLYHLLVACKARRGCQGYSYQDLPDCGD